TTEDANLSTDMPPISWRRSSPAPRAEPHRSGVRAREHVGARAPDRAICASLSAGDSVLGGPTEREGISLSVRSLSDDHARLEFGRICNQDAPTPHDFVRRQLKVYDDEVQAGVQGRLGRGRVYPDADSSDP